MIYNILDASAIAIAVKNIFLRKKKKITQKQLAELVNTKQPSIARLESGDYNPSLDFLKKIAEVLDANLEVNFISKA